MSNDGRSDPKVPGEISPEDREDIRKRSAEIGEKLEAAKERSKPKGARAAQGQAAAHGFRAASELIGGVIAGAGLGWVLDHWLGTWPILFISLFLLGAAAGMWNIIRVAMRERTSPPPSDQPPGA